MHRALGPRWLKRTLNFPERSSNLEIPLFLCPSIHRLPPTRPLLTSAVNTPVNQRQAWRIDGRRLFHAQEAPHADVIATSAVPDAVALRRLPKQCTGCGAFSQVSQPDFPGYFDLNRKAVKQYIGIGQKEDNSRSEDEIFSDALQRVNPEDLQKQGVDVHAFGLTMAAPEEVKQPEPQARAPICDRCHALVHHHTGKSIYHPTMESIRDTLSESPYKYNHVYHVLDAADFPMSILPQIHSLLQMMPMRSKNRRSRNSKFYHNQSTELSFVVTRSDLLAPTKAQVDKLKPYLQEVLREALGRGGRNVRLGNIRCVSAKRSWWTKELKEDIWKRAGAGWMVGKVNVGKSQLFESVFPKGRMDWKPSKHQVSIDLYEKNKTRDDLERLSETEDAVANKQEQTTSADSPEDEPPVYDEYLAQQDDLGDDYALLPPAQEESNYPNMPLVSDLPGTTASPIRVPFGNGRGELIDLPGIERTGLQQYVKEEHHTSMIMRSRVTPEQLVLKPGQSLTLGGGLIRITPREPAPVVLSYSFTPIQPHVTSTEKAVAIQTQSGAPNVENIATPEAADKMTLAGSFQLNTDVTKQRAGPLTAKDAVKLKVDRLPFRVLATDILIEGVGWVELVVQVRTKDLFPEQSESEKRLDEGPQDPFAELEAELSNKPPKKPAEASEVQEPRWPVVDVYSPEGKFVSSRRSMNGWSLNKPKATVASQKQRPRRSMKGAKKLEKQRRRQAGALSF